MELTRGENVEDMIGTLEVGRNCGNLNELVISHAFAVLSVADREIERRGERRKGKEWPGEQFYETAVSCEHLQVGLCLHYRTMKGHQDSA